MDQKEYKFEKYKKLLEHIKKEISTDEFKNKLYEMQKIDLHHYSKKITIEELKLIIEEFIEDLELEEEKETDNKKLLILLPGNPEIVFKVSLLSLKLNIDLMIGIQDFCLAQNTLIIDTINNVIKNEPNSIEIELKNLLKESQIIQEAKMRDEVICIGDSNLYNRLKGKIENINLNPYGIFDVYSDSEEFEDLENKFFEYCYQNEFEVESYDDVEFDDFIRLINKNGDNFCSVLFSKDKTKQKDFKENIKSKYIIINKNPFKEIKFKL